jgi:hypothetical protein
VRKSAFLLLNPFFFFFFCQPYTLKELTQLVAVTVNKKTRNRLTKVVEELKGVGIGAAAGGESGNPSA